MGLSFMSSLTVSNDLMANQFQARFVNIPGVTDEGARKQLTLRVKGSIDPPDNQIGTYEVEYQGVKYSMLSAKDDTDKTLTITFRLDSDWEIYGYLTTWLSANLNTSTGGASSSFTNYNTASSPTMYLDTFKSNKIGAKSIKYENIRLISMKVSSFDHSSNEPSEIECSFIYEMADLDNSTTAATVIGTT